MLNNAKKGTSGKLNNKKTPANKLNTAKKNADFFISKNKKNKDSIATIQKEHNIKTTSKAKLNMVFAK